MSRMSSSTMSVPEILTDTSAHDGAMPSNTGYSLFTAICRLPYPRGRVRVDHGTVDRQFLHAGQSRLGNGEIRIGVRRPHGLRCALTFVLRVFEQRLFEGLVDA